MASRREAEALERACRGLGREYVDLFMLHEQESLYTLRGHQEALDYLCEQKALGRIGAVGMSTHYVAAVKAAWRFSEIQVIHPLINAGGVGIQGGKFSQTAAIGLFATLINFVLVFAANTISNKLTNTGLW